MYEPTHDGADAPQTETCATKNGVPTIAESHLPQILERELQLLTTTLKSLCERGINSETKKHFGIRDFAGVGLVYKTSHLTGEAGPQRCMGMFPGQPMARWLGAEPEEPLPTVYNAEVLRDTVKCEGGLLIVQGEAEVWPLHQSGLAAAALFWDDHSGSEGSVKAAEELGTYLHDETPHHEVQLLFDNDAAGRLWALQVRLALRECEIRCVALSLGSWPEATLGFSVSDLFAVVGHDAIKFREAIGMLPLVPTSMLQSWEDDPTLDLPAARSEADEFYTCLNETQLEALPEPECLVEDVVLSSGVTLLTGKENLGKSAIAIALGASVSLGIRWNGQPTKAGLVYYIAAEGARGVHKRLNAWKKAMGIESTPHFHVLPMSVPLHEPVARERLIRTIEHHTARVRSEAVARGEVAPDVALVVVDTLAKTRGSLDENSPNDMTLYLEALNELYEKVGPAVLVLHHNNRSGEYRGSSSLTANADGHLMLVGESGSDQVVMKVAKLKDFADGQQFVLRRQIVELGVGKNGKLQTSVVFERDLEAEAELAAESGGETEGLSPKAKTTLRVLAKLSGENNGVGITSAVWQKAAIQEGVSKPTFDRAKRKLLDEGAVLCEKAGTAYARFTANPEYKP